MILPFRVPDLSLYSSPYAEQYQNCKTPLWDTRDGVQHVPGRTTARGLT